MLAREIEWINKQTDKEQANIQQLINNYIEQQHLLGVWGKNQNLEDFCVAEEDPAPRIATGSR